MSKLNSPIVSYSDIIEEHEDKNDRSSTITMALINIQGAEHSCSNSTTLCVYLSVCECERVQQSWKMGRSEHTVTHWGL